MGEKMSDIIKRLVEERKNKRRGESIICPYCEHEQDIATMYSHVSFWGEDSLTKIECEKCNKEFWIEEKVHREFETTTTEWKEAEDKRIQKEVNKIIKKEQEKK